MFRHSNKLMRRAESYYVLVVSADTIPCSLGATYVRTVALLELLLGSSAEPAQLEPNPYSAFDCQGVKFERNLAIGVGTYVLKQRDPSPLSLS